MTVNHDVTGSSPVWGAIFLFGGIPERPKGTDCKSVGSAFEGSNPSPSTRLVSLQFCRLTFFVVWIHFFSDAFINYSDDA